MGAAEGTVRAIAAISITTRKVADLIVFDRDLSDLAPHEIFKAEMFVTMLNGRVTHDPAVLPCALRSRDVISMGAVGGEIRMRHCSFYCSDCVQPRVATTSLASA